MFPTYLIVVGVILLALIVLALLLKRKFFATAVEEECLYELWKTILTPAEQAFVRALEESLPEGVRLLAKVRLADVFFTRKDLPPSRRTSARNRISQKYVDFLLIRGSDFAPLAGIELDEKSHEENRRKRRDVFVDRIFEGCRIPLLRIPAATTYNISELRAKIDTALLNPPLLSEA